MANLGMHATSVCFLLSTVILWSRAASERDLNPQISSLYQLRSKLSRSSAVGQDVDKTKIEKAARGYSFHYDPSNVARPSTYSKQELERRTGKLPGGVSHTAKRKYSSKNWDKYSKYAYKTSSAPEESGKNSFNLFVNHSTPTWTRSSTWAPQTSSKQPPSAGSAGLLSSSGSSGGFDLSKFATVGLGLNDAMTSMLTHKLMTMIDQDFPPTVVDPLKHLVAAGNRMVEFWDKRANARDGKPPGVVEMLGFGLEQLKKYRDGELVKSTDPVVNITSPSKTIIQGMITVKRLTNRVLGYATDDGAVESRGGYGHDSYGGGWGHHVSYGGLGGLDPFALLAALAFGAFLLQLLLTLLNTSARSLDVVDINTPLLLSDFHIPSFMTKMDKIFGTPTTRTRREITDEDSFFDSMVDRLDGMYKTYKTVSNKPSCARIYLCRTAVQNLDGDEESLSNKLYTFGLRHLVGDYESNKFMSSVQSRMLQGEKVDCNQEVKDCMEDN